jgi:hypothetical protein
VDAWVWVLIIVVLLAVALALWLAARKKKTDHLQDRFGPEYERTVTASGSRRDAEADLAEREKRRSELAIRPLAPASRERYITSWRDTQARFVDDPAAALSDADRLVQGVMAERGYPVDNFDQRAADISVDHPQVVENYRAGHGISLATEHGEASTEDMRQAMVHYRALFEELLETHESNSSDRSV